MRAVADAVGRASVNAPLTAQAYRKVRLSILDTFYAFCCEQGIATYRICIACDDVTLCQHGSAKGARALVRYLRMCVSDVPGNVLTQPCCHVHRQGPCRAGQQHLQICALSAGAPPITGPYASQASQLKHTQITLGSPTDAPQSHQQLLDAPGVQHVPQQLHQQPTCNQIPQTAAAAGTSLSQGSRGCWWLVQTQLALLLLLLWRSRQGVLWRCMTVGRTPGTTNMLATAALWWR
jgi:hypothetical protein